MSLDVSLYKGDEWLFSANITHNLNFMAAQVHKDFYTAIWRPENLGLTRAGEVADVIIQHIQNFAYNRYKYKQFDAPNGWGTYDDLMDFVCNYLTACLKNPEAIVSVDR